MSFQALPPEQLLGPLNEVEQQHAPKTLYFAGDAGILEQGAGSPSSGRGKPLKRGFAGLRGLQPSLPTEASWSSVGLPKGSIPPPMRPQ